MVDKQIGQGVGEVTPSAPGIKRPIAADAESQRDPKRQKTETSTTSVPTTDMPAQEYDEYVKQLLAQLEKAKEEKKAAAAELEAEKEARAAFQLETTRQLAAAQRELH